MWVGGWVGGWMRYEGKKTGLTWGSWYVGGKKKKGRTSSKSRPASSAAGQNLVGSTAGHTGKAGFQSCRAVTPGQLSSEGVPRRRKILKSWSISESPYLLVEVGEYVGGLLVCFLCLS